MPAARALFEVAARCSREQGRPIPIIYDLAYELLLHDPQAEPFDSALARGRSGHRLRDRDALQGAGAGHAHRLPAGARAARS